jgi:hypothetical protein
MYFGKPHGIADFTFESMALQVSESSGPVLRGQEKIQVFGGTAYPGVLQQCESAGDRVGNTLPLKSQEYLTGERFLLLWELDGNRRSYRKRIRRFVSVSGHVRNLPFFASSPLDRSY